MDTSHLASDVVNLSLLLFHLCFKFIAGNIQLLAHGRRFASKAI